MTFEEYKEIQRKLCGLSANVTNKADWELRCKIYGACEVLTKNQKYIKGLLKK